MLRIFNEKEVDEIIILDIDASKMGNQPKFEFLADITGEAFMPLAYGGGISNIAQAENLFYNGIEKIVLNSIMFSKEGECLVKEITSKYGTQSVIISIDIKYNLWGKAMVYSHSSKKITTTDPLEFAKKVADMGAGELFINIVNRDGTYKGYDLDLLKSISSSVNIPVIICGGASSINDFEKAEEYGASAMAAGSMFIFRRPHNAVLISYLQ